MAIETRIQPRQTIQNVAYGFICLVLGLWGWYDYSIKIPTRQAAFDEYTLAEKAKSSLEERARTAPLGEAEKAEYKAAELILAKYKEKPAEPAAYDRPVQLWLYIVGCGVLGVPWFAYAQWDLSRRRYRLGDDGSFSLGGTTYAAAQITGVDMSRWMSKSIATVEIEGGGRVVLDDYKYKGVEDIVAQLAARFHPGQWTSDARPIGDPKSRDTKKQREAEEAAALAALEAQQAAGEAPEQDSRT